MKFHPAQYLKRIIGAVKIRVTIMRIKGLVAQSLRFFGKRAGDIRRRAARHLDRLKAGSVMLDKSAASRGNSKS
jgi:hypothetical protein